MEEYARVTPGKRKILEQLDTLKPYEKMEITADKDGKPDTFLVFRSVKVVVKGMFEEPTK
jgi:uncharacterized protein (DUF2249 family)